MEVNVRDFFYCYVSWWAATLAVVFKILWVGILEGTFCFYKAPPRAGFCNCLTCV